MLTTIAIILVVLWLLGLVTSSTLGGFIHILLVIAIIMILIRLIQGRRVLWSRHEWKIGRPSSKFFKSSKNHHERKSYCCNRLDPCGHHCSRLLGNFIHHSGRDCSISRVAHRNEGNAFHSSSPWSVGTHRGHWVVNPKAEVRLSNPESFYIACVRK